MKDDVATEAPRLRPLSGGLWTLFSWLRRDERSSTESISSSGSGHTATSFSFLSPAQYRTNSKQFILPWGPVTDTYKERVRERNIRRQIECDLTLRRKYGLFRGDCGNNYNTSTLPASCKNKSENINRLERDRRATSECGQRRAPYVVGKRRAPLPPIQNFTTLPSTSLTRRARKRPAPPPPVKSTEIMNTVTLEEKIGMNTNTEPHKMGDKQPTHNLERNNKECGDKKKAKSQAEKGFIKQFFEKRKRNSVSEFSATKLLPNISELDKEAAEIIKKNKERNVTLSSALEENNWICTSCLRKYSQSMVSCLYCDQGLNFHATTETQKKGKLKIMYAEKTEDEKVQLKKMLKEMKDSLPKKSKSDNNKPSQSNHNFVNSPTLPIGTSVKEYSNRKYQIKPLGQENYNNRFTFLEERRPTKELNLPSTSENNVSNTLVLPSPSYFIDDKNKFTKVDLHNKNASFDKDLTKRKVQMTASTEKGLPKIDETVELNNKLVISQPIEVLSIPKSFNLRNVSTEDKIISKNCNSNKIMLETNNTKENFELTKTEKLQPLSKSSLIDYKTNITPEAESTISAIKLEKLNSINQPSTSNKVTENTELKMNPKLDVTTGGCIKTIQNVSEDKTKLCSDASHHDTKVITPKHNEEKKADLKNNKNTNIDQYAQRRELINLLEKSIAKGDERGAADAAARLAQLRLSCSVLSFSSNIVADNSSIKDSNVQIINTKTETKEQNKIIKIDSATQSGTENILRIKQSNNKKYIIKDKSDSSIGPSSKFGTENTLKIKQSDDKKHINKDESDSSSGPNSKFGITAGNVLMKPSTSFPVNDIQKNENISINVWVEDKDAARGPIRLQVLRGAVMRDLRKEAETAFGIASNLQRWIVGRTLCTNNSTSLATLAGPELGAPFYLCLVESDTSNQAKRNIDQTETRTSPLHDHSGKSVDVDVYTELMQLEQHAIVANNEAFECGVCLEECAAGEGAVLRDCVHSFCKNCLSDVVRHSQEAIVTCPATGCNGVIQEREIRALVSSEDYERWLARGLAAAESGTRNSFHCRTKDCTGWALCETGVRRFPCPVCKHVNCVPCQAIHEGETCEQHRLKLQEAEKMVEGNQIDDGTKSLFENLITRGEALECPECKAMIIKKWGCDWVKCVACKTEICWITRGRRWGPAGRGDVSAGCRCGVDGKRCHPSCGYCH